jgi:hypothetical protein
LAIEPKVDQVCAQLNRTSYVDDASRTEYSYSVARARKRAPAFDLAGAALSDLGVIDVVSSAEPCG